MQATTEPTYPLLGVVVIRGGPAGLVAATYLARFRRTVCVVDANRSRLAEIPRSHNHPGFAEESPARSCSSTCVKRWLATDRRRSR